MVLVRMMRIFFSSKHSKGNPLIVMSLFEESTFILFSAIGANSSLILFSWCFLYLSAAY